MLTFNKGELIINESDYTVHKNNVSIPLTKSEFSILITLARKPKKVFTREELIEIAFDGDFEGYNRTIDAHIKNIRGKIESNKKDYKYIITIRGIGYQFGGDYDS